MQTVYRYWSAIIFLAIVVQVGFAGYGAFDVANNVEDATVNEDSYFDSFAPHAVLGYLLLLGGLLLLLIALAARVGRRRVGHAGALFGLLVLQMVLAWIGFGVPVIGFLHPVNALVLFALAGWIARNAWRGEPMAPAPPAAAA